MIDIILFNLLFFGVILMILYILYMIKDRSNYEI